MSALIEVDEFSIDKGEQPLHYRTNVDGEIPSQRGTRPPTAEFLVRLDVDGEHTQVVSELNGSSAIEAMRRAIEALTDVCDQLERMIPQDLRGGQCMTQGDWGRCKAGTGHPDGAHDFPTESEWRSLQAVREGLRSA